MASSFRCSTAFLGTLTAILYYRYIIVPLILVSRIVDAVTCPSESSGSSVSGSSSSSSGLNKPTTITKRKVCPDFKDNEDEKYCCPSHIIPGSYYCCSQEHLYKIEAEQAAEIRRQFIKKLVSFFTRPSSSLSLFSLRHEISFPVNYPFLILLRIIVLNLTCPVSSLFFLLVPNFSLSFLFNPNYYRECKCQLNKKK